MGNQTSAGGDWLYTALLREATSYSLGRDLLIEEYADSRNVHVRGRVLRAWFHDREGTRELSEHERKEIRLKLRGRSVYPFTFVGFHVSADRRAVVAQWLYGARAGRGWSYYADERGSSGTLRRNPNGPAWIA